MKIKIPKINISLSLKIVFSIIFAFIIVIRIYFVIQNKSTNVSGSGNIVENSSIDNSNNSGNITDNSTKVKFGDIIGNNNTVNVFSGTSVDTDQYTSKRDTKGNIILYSKEKRAEQAVAVRGFSVDEVIARTPICRLKHIEPECTVPACFASVKCQEREDRMNVANVIDHATKPTPYERWNVRARALYLLGYVKNEMLTKGDKSTWEAVLDTVTKAINEDKNLFVRREALKTFDKLTDFDRKDDFDFGSASKWWCSFDNRKAAMRKLKEEQR